jgi:hypothetical protein
VTKLKITIQPINVKAENQLTVFEVTVDSDESTWIESFATKQLVEAFTRGVEATLSMCNERDPEFFRMHPVPAELEFKEPK